MFENFQGVKLMGLGASLSDCKQNCTNMKSSLTLLKCNKKILVIDRMGLCAYSYDFFIENQKMIKK